MSDAGVLTEAAARRRCQAQWTGKSKNHSPRDPCKAPAIRVVITKGTVSDMCRYHALQTARIYKGTGVEVKLVAIPDRAPSE